MRCLNIKVNNWRGGEEMSKDITVTDPETGVTLRYHWNDKTGYSFIVSGYDTREEMRKASLLATKYWPTVPHTSKKI